MTTGSYFAFARHALVAGLQHLGIQPGDEIGIPELICRDVLASIAEVGAKAQFYPVDQALRPTGCGTAGSARAVLMVNYFGFPQQIADFTGLWPHAVLIEDNAHGYLSRDSDGILLGTRTPVGITSIRKTIHIPEGALLTTGSPLEQHLEQPIVDRRPSRSFLFRDFAATAERSTGLPVQQVSRLAIRTVRRFRTGSTLPLPDPRSEISLPIPATISHWSMNKIKNLDGHREVARRRHLFNMFLNELPSNQIQIVFTALPEGCSPYGFPFISPVIPTSIRRLARRHHCEVISWPDLPGASTVASDHFYRNLKVVNFI